MKITLSILAFAIVALAGGYFLFGGDSSPQPPLTTKKASSEQEPVKPAPNLGVGNAQEKTVQEKADQPQPIVEAPEPEPASESVQEAVEENATPRETAELPMLDMKAVIQGFQAKSNGKALSTLPPGVLEEVNKPLEPHSRSGRLSGTPPFIDYVSLAKHGVNKNPDYRRTQFPAGYGIVLRFEVVVSRDLPFPNNHPIYIEPLGGDRVYQGYLVRQSNSMTNDEVVEREKSSTYYEGMRLEGRVVIPWESAYSNMLVYDDRSNPQVFGMAAMANRPVRLYLDPPTDSDQEARYLRVLDAKGQPVSSGYVLKGDQVVGEVSGNGVAAVAWGGTQRTFSRSDLSHSVIVDGYLETSVNSGELAKASLVPFDVKIPIKELSVFVQGGDSWLESNVIDWKSGLFFSDTNNNKKLAVPCFGVRNVAPHQLWGMVAGLSIDCAVVVANDGLTRDDLQNCGQNILSRIGDRVALGADSAGRYHIRLPHLAGVYLFAIQDRAARGRSENAEATYVTLNVSEAMLKQADQSSTPIDLKLEAVDIKKDYLTIQGTGPAAGNGWLRYYYGDLGHKAMPPFCPENPTPEPWPGK